MKRLGTEPDDFITPVLRRVMDLHPEVRQRDLARALGCSESRIAHIKRGEQRLVAHELVVFCDVFDTSEPLDAMADRLHFDLVERPRSTASTATLRSHVAGLMRDVGILVVELETTLSAGDLAPRDIEVLASQLQAVIEGARAAKARLPRPTARGGAR